MKNELRKISLQKRKELDVKISSEKVLKNLFSLDEYKKAQNILTYFPLKYEIQTQCCFSNNSKTWYLPRVNGEELEVCKYETKKISKGNFNIQEPTNEKILNLDFLDMVIIPCVAADKNGYRIGYGKGYYDRFLPLLPKTCKKVLLVYSDLLFESVYPDEYDVKVDVLVTDKQILRF
ncbi:MAG: 5-formyltetrahydrofolate cyclo-ligase [Candidatus Gastranaerophilales bacterium]|nr:5-formyltetrahydrofolate cyclo-ligase [Candidatus Gastranaerophilales bacterium]